MIETKELTGKASIDRPWMKYYPEPMRNLEIPALGVTEFLKAQNPDQTKPAIEYYGRILTWTELWSITDRVAKSLKVLGFGEGSYIPSFLLAVPEHLMLLLAAERIGAILLCRDDTPEELAYAIRKSKSSIIFAHDYISREEEELYLAETSMRRIVKVSPYTYAKREEIPDYIESQIAARYEVEQAANPENMTWEEFLALGDGYTGPVDAPRDIKRPLFGAYTSGSTSYPKLVIHCAEGMVGVLSQLTIFAPPSDPQQRWLTILCPPALVAITNAWILFPLSTGKRLILDPFCAPQDVDLELMRYRPDFFALIPLIMRVLMNSKRIPEDFSLEFLQEAGVGAEPMNNKQVRQAQRFLTEHKSRAIFNVAYGQSEGGSGFTLPCPVAPALDGCCGMPMVHTTLAVFEPGTSNELGYNELGEICKTGVGNMLGYKNVDADSTALKVHEDGKIWVHTGDFGYMTEDGAVYVLSRGRQERFGGGYLFSVRMENKVVEVPGVKDGFFYIAPDRQHEGYFVPYLYLIPEEGYTLEDLRENIHAALEPHERPANITVIKERPYFHFKTAARQMYAKYDAQD